VVAQFATKAAKNSKNVRVVRPFRDFRAEKGQSVKLSDIVIAQHLHLAATE
jgi:hypothetical protein